MSDSRNAIPDQRDRLHLRIRRCADVSFRLLLLAITDEHSSYANRAQGGATQDNSEPRQAAESSIFRHAASAIQRKIASILSAYDDLIENNTRRIAILEADGPGDLSGVVRGVPLPRPREGQARGFAAGEDSRGVEVPNESPMSCDSLDEASTARHEMNRAFRTVRDPSFRQERSKEARCSCGSMSNVQRSRALRANCGSRYTVA